MQSCQVAFKARRPLRPRASAYDTLSIGDPMRSRSARLTCVAVAWIALGAAGYFAFTSHSQLTARAEAIRAVDQHAREAIDALSDLRAAQQAYVAGGQDVAFWVPK